MPSSASCERPQEPSSGVAATNRVDMAYGAIEHDALADDDSTSASPPPPPLHLESVVFQPLKLDFSNLGSGGLIMEQYEQLSLSSGLNKAAQSILSQTKTKSYDVLATKDFSDGLSPSPEMFSGIKRVGNNDAQDERTTLESHNQTTSVPSVLGSSSNPMLRTASGRAIPLRHPTPDLHVLQGAYVAHVEHLEKTAEKLSMTSSIDDAIRELHNEQKRSDSRRSSLMRSPIEMRSSTRQSSSSGSIVDVNNAARSGGFSPGGYMISQRQSISASNRVRSASKSSRFSSRPEPEREGRPLDIIEANVMPAASPILSRAASIAEQNEDSPTITPPLAEPTVQASKQNSYSTDNKEDRPTTPASTNTYEQAQRVFGDFDGEHIALESKERTADAIIIEGHSISSEGRSQISRPQSYADPATGQQMVYYPAPVPVMLNLPQKLSKAPPKDTRNKRKSQVLSSIPSAARQSAVWLPDVLEDEGDADPSSKDATEANEYMPQHHRRTIGGRQSTLDLQHLPPQLRASTFFEKPGINQKIEIKGESAVATLDSILDAAAFAPVNAFTDHAFAGRLGSEVYGTSNKKVNKPVDKIPESDQGPKKLTKRKSFSTLLGLGGDAGDLDGNYQRRSRVSALDRDKGTAFGGANASGQEVNENELEDDEDEEGQADDVYHGPPTTLLAELQLRKQHQQQRTRPVAATYPNGMRTTLLELDAVAQVEKNTRKQKRVNLAWEDPTARGMEDDGEEDEDVPLGVLFPSSAQAHQDRARPLGLMERRELEDNEPLSRRRDRLQGKPRAAQRASTMIGAAVIPPEDDDETLAQRIQRLKAQGGTTAGLPTARPVSVDFTSELMSQFGGDAMEAVSRGKAKELFVNSASEEEETLGQRRKRLQAERVTRSKEAGAGAGSSAMADGRLALKQKHSMADILNTHPVSVANRQSSYNLDKPSVGLMGQHEQHSKRVASALLDAQNSAATQRGSTLIDIQDQPKQAPRANTLLDLQSSYSTTGFKNGMYNNGAGGMTQPQLPTQGYGGYNSAFIPSPYQPGMELGGYAQQQQMMYPFTTPFTTMGYGGMAYTGLGGNGMVGGHGMGHNVRANPMAANMLQVTNQGHGLNQGQIDMVERWRQSVMQ